MTSRREIALLRLVALGLVGERSRSPLEAVRRLGALQAQELPGALVSVALRVAGGTREAVEEALSSGQVVRSWPMRGTLHLVPAVDLVWILSLATPRNIAGAATRRTQLGIDDGVLERARETALAATLGGPGLRRAELMELWSEAGLLAAPQAGYHLLARLCQEGLLVQGPMSDDEQLVVAVADWVPEPVRLGREEALGEWALRYFTSHGPATVKDFARWSSLTMSDVRAGIASVRTHLTSMEVDGVEYLLDPRTPELLEQHRTAARGVFLLPGFDEFMLGYADRSAALPPEHAERIVPGGNGVFQPTVVSAGEVVGTWKRVRRAKQQTVEAVPFTAFTARTEAEIARRFAALP
jgi:hypothetical protein